MILVNFPLQEDKKLALKILVASDGSDNALRAAGFAAGLAGLSPDIKVTVLVVNDMLEKMKYYSRLRS
ncbi:MAG: universal stress protein, partial [Firmicutes bacterium]|nr:universal stress protein [Bacillota bacterium]